MLHTIAGGYLEVILHLILYHPCKKPLALDEDGRPF
jgi:hypothetical protein